VNRVSRHAHRRAPTTFESVRLAPPSSCASGADIPDGAPPRFTRVMCALYLAHASRSLPAQVTRLILYQTRHTEPVGYFPDVDVERMIVSPVDIGEAPA
jgi:hypothetical protein